MSDAATLVIACILVLAFDAGISLVIRAKEQKR